MRTCLRCGAAIVDEALHARWHEHLVERLAHQVDPETGRPPAI